MDPQGELVEIAGPAPSCEQARRPLAPPPARPTPSSPAAPPPAPPPPRPPCPSPPPPPPPPPPAPSCEQTELPAALFATPAAPPLAAALIDGLTALAARVTADAPPDKRAEHASKTYALVAAVARERARRGAAAEFFVVGSPRKVEKARAHLHSSMALGVFDVSGLVPAPPPASGQ